jgi:phenylacetate-CoA ligase
VKASWVEVGYRRVPVWAQNVLVSAYGYRVHRHRYGRPGQRALAEAMRFERLPPAEIRQYQDERIRTIVAHAYDRSRYYRSVLDAAGLSPGGIRGVADLNRLPLLHKETVRDHGAELLTSSRPLGGWWPGQTTGTTGTPLSLWYDRETCIRTGAVERRFRSWLGLASGDWTGILLGRVIVPPAQERPPFWRTNVARREVWFSNLHMSDDTLGYYVDEIRRRRLRFLDGYPSTLFILADHLRRSGQTLPMQAAITSSETLHPVQREAIEAAFQCPVFDFYAAAERVIFAGECEEHSGKHVAEDYGYVEVVDGDGQPVADGEAGFLVGTSLHNTATPMIRYRTDDVSRILTEPCVCGRPLRRIAGVATKATDVILTPEGRLVAPPTVAQPLRPIPEIRNAQFIQERRDHLLVKLVTAAPLEEAQERRLVTGLRERLGPTMAIQVEYVEAIPREPTGKYRFVISHVANPVTVDWSRMDLE